MNTHNQLDIAKTSIWKYCLLIGAWILTWLMPYNSFSQQTKSVKDVFGKWVVSNDITIQQAREKAINEAKAEALRVAGVNEVVSSTNLLFSSEQNNLNKELFESLITVDSYGVISDYTINKEEKKIDEFGNVIYQVWINARIVINYESKDQGFGFDIKGIHDSFSNHDKLSFEIKPWKNGYLKVFILANDSGGMLLYPNDLERVELLKEGQSYTFPRTRALDYELSTDKKSELNYFLFLFTKEEVAFKGEQTPQNILRYISQIRPNAKYLKSFPIVIKGTGN